MTEKQMRVLSVVATLTAVGMYVSYIPQIQNNLAGNPGSPLQPLVAAINYLLERGASDVTAICLIAAPEGIKTLEEAVGDRANVTVVTAAQDDHLNEKAYIVPGLGDAGDRLYGIVD